MKERLKRVCMGLTDLEKWPKFGLWAERNGSFLTDSSVINVQITVS